MSHTRYYWALPEYSPFAESLRNTPTNPIVDRRLHIGDIVDAGPWCDVCGMALNSSGVFGLLTKRGKELDKCPCCEREPQTTCAVFVWSSLAHKSRLRSFVCDGNVWYVVRASNKKLLTARQMLGVVALGRGVVAETQRTKEW